MNDSEYMSKIKQANEDPYGPFILEMGDGREFYAGKKIRRYAPFAALDSMYGPFPVLENKNTIPVEIAVESNSVLATYLMLVYESHYDMSWEDELREVATKLDVQVDTVRKYLRRVVNQL
jgi:hypothetical protein